MFLPCATVRRVMPGQISIVGFSRFISGISCGKPGHANISSFRFSTCHSSRITGKIQAMKIPTLLSTILLASLLATPSFAQTTASSPPAGTGSAAASGGQPNQQEMMKQMMEMAKLNENHKLLTDLDGNWNYTIKFWMNPDPNAKPEESKGTAVRKSMMDGRYSTLDVTGKMEMP